MNRFVISAFFVLAATYPALAQGHRGTALPDTLGANFPLADTATKSGTLADYDALIGVWHFALQWRNPDGSFGGPLLGHWTFERKSVGLIEDQWRADDPSSPMDIGIHTYRTFDPERNLWQMMGRDREGGFFAPGLTWSDGANRYGIQHNGPNVIVRIRYFAIGPDTFSWRSDRSDDGGKTWLRDAATMKVTRVGK